MKDPYLDDYDRYLDSLNRFAAPKRNYIQPKDSSTRSGLKSLLLATACAFVAVGMIVPWAG